MAVWLPAKTLTDSIKVRSIAIRMGRSRVARQPPKQSYAKLKKVRKVVLEILIFVKYSEDAVNVFASTQSL